MNPFAQNEQYWKVVFTVPSTAAGTADDSFDDIALSVAGFETDEKGHIWTFDLLFGTAPDMEEIKRRLMIVAALHGLPAIRAQLSEVKQQDWLARVARDFPPIAIGRYYVHGSHVKNVPVGSIEIQVEAGAAFGSGEHGTTHCCLEAMDWLARKRQFTHVLDMGCGSGILAIAAAKTWRTNVLAADIDPVAVRVTQENAKKNRAAMETIISDGYANPAIARAAPFDLIVSNILARPLVAFAPDLAAHLVKGGMAVLSGLLTAQETQVRSAHQMQGLKLEKRFTQGEWCTLVLSK